MYKEFKEFISRGNVFDLAVAVMIGAAFSKIVESLVKDMMMPVIGILFGGVNFAGMSYRIKAEVIYYGAFIQALVDFFLVAASIFLMIKIFNRLRGKGDSYEIKAATQLEVLAEIREILKRMQDEKDDDLPAVKGRRTSIRFKKRD
ncbi:large conductance mechanosensitive channel protein MscL [Rossellomorea vietnamensis]|uniref:Large-conductance mechanosensitive channel n=1 Tax=Rossellomorea vietnamensis TaxID=218284 RepID=A0A5D4K889_9BACI|nr:large conductance mechanosensitive channel protein MscL [Rossellomorea vietnamensis]TYR73236.1 large conductance mechanosensitive channel protein MscL [Rossellomorea vietnamensis]